MLEGTDCIYVDEFMQSVLLIKKINKINSKYLNLSELLNKFHIGIPKNIIGGWVMNIKILAIVDEENANDIMSILTELKNTVFNQ